MKFTSQVDNQGMLAELKNFRAAVADKASMLKICGVLMLASIARTFREEGSPASSWPKLAASTLSRPGYTAGHKLLILSGRLFGSFTYEIAGNVLTVGTALPYAAVHQFGSRDWMGGAAGPRTAAQMLGVGSHSGTHLKEIYYRMRHGIDSRGRAYSVPEPMSSGKHEIDDTRGHRRTVSAKYQGPRQQTEHEVEAHTRRQNIPARPFLVFRPKIPVAFSPASRASCSARPLG